MLHVGTMLQEKQQRKRKLKALLSLGGSGLNIFLE